MLGMEDQLDETAAVAQVDEDQAAVIATAVNPAGDAQLLTDVVLADLAAPDRPVAVRARRLSHAGSSSDSIAATAASNPCTSCSEPPARMRIESAPTIATASAPIRPACRSCPFNE